MKPWTAEPASKERIILLLLCLLYMFCGSWILPLLDRDEPRFAEASREMLQRQDFIIPWLNGVYRFDKPPLIYWCQMAAYQVLGENALAARLPSFVFASGTAFLLLAWGRRAAGPKSGFWAAVLFITTAGALIHSRLAVADMSMVFFFTAAVWSGWEMSGASKRSWNRWWWSFSLSLGLGFLAKGPVAWLPLVGLGVAKWLRPQQLRISWAHLGGGLALALGIVALWGVPALYLTQGEFLRVGLGRHVVQRSMNIMEGHGLKGLLGYVSSLPFYFLTFFASFFPWSFYFPKTAWRWWKSENRDALGKYLLIQAGIVFAIFTLIRTKLFHYILPAYPCLALWLARQTTALPGDRPWLKRGAAIMAVFVLAVTLLVFPWLKPRFVARSLFEQCRPYMQPRMRMAATGFVEPSLVWEFRSIITNTVMEIPEPEMASFVKQEGPFILVMPTALLQPSLLAVAPAHSLIMHVSGINWAHGKKVEVSALLWDGRKLE